ncbi:MAG: hypothetical protein JNJ83_16275 [Verrucomicrobiaceae bacterium]|nr:hypothetical protein [Verrucomicrobiaceae bacterium]
MTKLTTILSALALATAANAGTSAPAPSGKACNSCNACATPAADTLGFGISASYNTHYIFRGVEFGENWVQGRVDYTHDLTDTTKLVFDASYGFLAGDDSALNSLVGTDLSYQRLELGAGLVTDLGPVELGVGYRFYHHDGDLGNILEDTHEVGVTLGKKIGALHLGMGAYYDITNEGWYFEAKAATEIKVCEGFKLVPAVGIGYAVDYDWQLVTDAAQLNGFTAVNVSLAAPITVAKNVTITPYIAANLPIDALDDAGEDTQVYGGVSVTIKF